MVSAKAPDLGALARAFDLAEVAKGFVPAATIAPADPVKMELESDPIDPDDPTRDQFGQARAVAENNYVLAATIDRCDLVIDRFDPARAAAANNGGQATGLITGPIAFRIGTNGAIGDITIATTSGPTGTIMGTTTITGSTTIGGIITVGITRTLPASTIGAGRRGRQ